jgi:carboxypeptidase Taq
MQDTVDRLRGRLAEISDLERIARLLGWEQRTMMPPRGAPARAQHACALHL